MESFSSGLAIGLCSIAIGLTYLILYVEAGEVGAHKQSVIDAGKGTFNRDYLRVKKYQLVSGVFLVQMFSVIIYQQVGSIMDNIREYNETQEK